MHIICESKTMVSDKAFVKSNLLDGNIPISIYGNNQVIINFRDENFTNLINFLFREKNEYIKLLTSYQYKFKLNRLIQNHFNNQMAAQEILDIFYEKAKYKPCSTDDFQLWDLIGWDSDIDYYHYHFVADDEDVVKYFSENKESILALINLFCSVIHSKREELKSKNTEEPYQFLDNSIIINPLITIDGDKLTNLKEIVTKYILDDQDKNIQYFLQYEKENSKLNEKYQKLMDYNNNGINNTVEDLIDAMRTIKEIFSVRIDRVLETDKYIKKESR